MSDLIYTVEEKNRLGQWRARLLTRDPLMALSDWLIRAHRPLGFPPGIKPRTGDFRLEITGEQMPLESDELQLEGYFTHRGEVVRSFILKTSVATLEIDEGFSSSSAQIYKTQEYWDAIEKMKVKIDRYAQSNLYVAYILAQFAGRDVVHPFWRPSLFSRGRGLNY